MSILGLQIGRSALQAHQAALNATSQNIANANTEGYTRKTIHLEATNPLAAPGLGGSHREVEIGTGVEISSIQGVRDLLLNQRIRTASGEEKRSEKEEDYLRQIEVIFTGEQNPGALLDDFFAALQDLANRPESLAVRRVVADRGDALAEGIRTAYQSLDDLRDAAEAEVRTAADEINTIASKIADLNLTIAGVKSSTLEPNDAEDQRQTLLEDLAEIVDVQVVNGENGTITVLAGSQVVVQAGVSFAVEAARDTNNGNLSTVKIAGAPAGSGELFARRGSLRGLLEVRDEVIPEILDDLNELALTLIDRVNAVHASGFGLDGGTGRVFFKAPETAVGERRVYRIEGSSFVDRLDLPLDGDSSSAGDENFEANPIGVGSFTLNAVSISYDASVDTLQDIADRINASAANAQAYVTETNRLVITGTPGGGNEILNLLDGGNLLSRLGILQANGSFPATGADPAAVLTGTVTRLPFSDVAARIEVDANILADVTRIAAAQGDDLSEPPDGVGDVSRGPGDGANALALADLKFKTTLRKGATTLNDFAASIAGEVGGRIQVAENRRIAFADQRENLEARRSEVSGVSIDEEVINLLKFQRGFEAAARIIRAMDEALQVVIGLGARG